MKLGDVTPLTVIAPQYGAGLNRAKTLTALQNFLADWTELAPDAHEQVQAWDAGTFSDFQRCLKLERLGKFSGDDAASRFGAVLMPMVLIIAQMTATDTGTTDGLALLRHIEHGTIKPDANGQLRFQGGISRP